MMLADVPDEWRGCVASMLELPAYHKACTALEARSPVDIRKALDGMPAGVRELVEPVARKLYARRIQTAGSVFK